MLIRWDVFRLFFLFFIIEISSDVRNLPKFLALLTNIKRDRQDKRSVINHLHLRESPPNVPHHDNAFHHWRPLADRQ